MPTARVEASHRTLEPESLSCVVLQFLVLEDEVSGDSSIVDYADQLPGFGAWGHRFDNEDSCKVTGGSAVTRTGCI